MLKLAHQKQHALEPIRTAERSPVAQTSAGKHTLTEPFAAPSAGSPDIATRATAIAERTIAALRTRLLPAYLDARGAERVRLAIQIRYMISCANHCVVAVEAPAALRATLETVVRCAVQLGACSGADTDLPRRHVEQRTLATQQTDHAVLRRKRARRTRGMDRLPASPASVRAVIRAVGAR